MSRTSMVDAMGPAGPTTKAAPAPRKPGRPVEPVKPASREAQRCAAVVLEVLAGLRRPSEAAAALNVSLPRYYLWEQRALAGLVAGCEPRPPGKAASERHRIAVLQKEVTRLRQDCARQQALVRAAQRTIGLAPPPAAKPAKAGEKGLGKAAGQPGGKRARKRRPAVRALKAAASLRAACAARENAGVSSSAVAMEVVQRCSEGGTPGLTPATPATGP